MQLADFCGSGAHGAQVHGVTNGRVPGDVAAAGGCMVAVQSLHTQHGMISCSAIATRRTSVWSAFPLKLMKHM